MPDTYTAASTFDSYIASVPTLLFRVLLAIVLIILPLAGGWYAAWKLVLHKVPLFQEIFGLKPKTNKKSSVTYSVKPPAGQQQRAGPSKSKLMQQQRKAGAKHQQQQQAPAASNSANEQRNDVQTADTSTEPAELRALREKLAAATGGGDAGIRVQKTKR